MRAPALLVLLAALSLSAPLGAEEERRAWLELTPRAGTERCPDQAALEHAISNRLGYPAFVPDAPIQVEVALSRAGAGFVAELVTRGPGDEPPSPRSLSAPTCALLFEHITTVVVVLLELDPSPPPPALPPPALPPSPPPLPSPPPAPSPPVPLRLGIGLGVHLALGTAPSPAPGLDLGVRLRRGAWSVALEGRWDRSSAGLTFPSHGLVELRSQLVTGTLVPCIHAWFLHGCALVGAGVRQITVTAPEGSSDSVSRAIGALGLRLGAEARLGPSLAAQLAVDLAMPLVSTPYRIGEPSSWHDAWTPPPVSVIFGAGFAVPVL